LEGGGITGGWSGRLALEVTGIRACADGVLTVAVPPSLPPPSERMRKFSPIPIQPKHATPGLR
jgi:hypothetical protein